MKEGQIRLYTDGSCHSQLLLGAWASLLLMDKEEIVLKGIENDTTHNRMELMAVIKGLEYIEEKKLDRFKILIYSDSQYVVNLTTRMDKLKLNDFITRKGTPIRNADLVQILIQQIKIFSPEFIKVKAHVKNGDEFNRKVDVLARNLVRKNCN